MHWRVLRSSQDPQDAKNQAGVPKTGLKSLSEPEPWTSAQCRTQVQALVLGLGHTEDVCHLRGRNVSPRESSAEALSSSGAVSGDGASR